MSTYEVEYQVHESQTEDDWNKVRLDEAKAHAMFDTYQKMPDILAVRVVRVDRTIIREDRKVQP